MIEAPPRSAQQRLDALERSAWVRRERAWLKNHLAHHPDDVVPYIAEPPEWLERMRLSTLLCAMRYHGPHRVSRVLMRCGIPWEKRVGSLTQRQRDAITQALS